MAASHCSSTASAPARPAPRAAPPGPGSTPGREAAKAHPFPGEQRAAGAISAVQASAPSQTQSSAAGASSAADSTRLRRSRQRPPCRGGGDAGPIGGLQGEAPAGTDRVSRHARRSAVRAAPYSLDGVREMAGAEVGPEHVLEDELGIGRLPQQEVGQALLAGGADDQVGVGHPGGAEARGEARPRPAPPGRGCRRPPRPRPPAPRRAISSRPP